jgi:hypothetical protein
MSHVDTFGNDMHNIAIINYMLIRAGYIIRSPDSLFRDFVLAEI